MKIHVISLAQLKSEQERMHEAILNSAVGSALAHQQAIASLNKAVSEPMFLHVVFVAGDHSNISVMNVGEGDNYLHTRCSCRTLAQLRHSRIGEVEVSVQYWGKKCTCNGLKHTFELY